MREFDMVVSGMGVVSALGLRTEDFFSYLRTGGEIPRIEPGGLVKHLKIADPKFKISRYMDPVSKNCIVALSAAMADAGITAEDISADPFRYSIVMGTTRGAYLTREALYGTLASREGRLVSGTLFSHCGYNIAGALAAIAYGIKGINITLAGRGDVGQAVLGRAGRFIMSGRADTVFAGFTECGGPPGGSGPHLGEMAFFLCLEKKERAAERGAAHRTEISAQRPADGPAAGVVYGFKGEGDAAGEEIMKLPLPGMKAPADHYSSLLMAGLLGAGGELGEKYGSTAFAAGSGENGAVFRIAYP